jgi:Rrf2 family protein
MKLTFKGDYALKALLDLSMNSVEPQSIDEIAKRQDIPPKFLEQIMLELKKGGFVKALRGKNGGYLLSRDAGKITMGQVIRYVEGPVEPIACIKDSGTCSYSAKCSFRGVLREIGEFTAKKVDSVTFARLRDEQLKKDKKYQEYCI